MSAKGTKNVETVLGPVPVSKLGRTLTHEHLVLNFEKFHRPPPKNLKQHLDGKISLQNVGYVKQYPYSNEYNLKFNDADTISAVLQELLSFGKFGGGTIVENSCHGLGRDIKLLRKLSLESKVNIVAGTGFYVAITQSPSTLKMTQEAMYDLMHQELTINCCDDDVPIKAGFIGEVGSDWPIRDFEKRAICATGELQEQLDCPVSFHPGRDCKAPWEVIRIYQEAGGNANRAIMSHAERTFLEMESIISFVDSSHCYCQFDLFGVECSFYQLNPDMDMPSDAARIKYIKEMKEEGNLDRILLSHDIHTKHRLVAFGGHGYSHIQNNVLPVMLKKGFTKEDIEILTIKNPKQWLGGQ